MSRRPLSIFRAMLIALGALIGALISPRDAAALPGSTFKSFQVGERDGELQRFRLEFDKTGMLRVRDELITRRYFYLDIYDVDDPGGNRDWALDNDAGVFHVKQIYYPSQRVLRFVFYCRKDAWFAVRTVDASIHEVQVRPIAYMDLGRVDRSLGGSVKKVIIDPGHGGNPTDGKHHLGGRSSRKINGRYIDEKEVTLQIAKRLEGLVRKAPNLEVLMTRQEDRYIGLEERVELARKAGGDLFVSIHTNATSRRVKSARGFEIYYLSDGSKETNRELVALENEGVSLDDTLSYRETLRDLIRKLADEAMVQRQAESRMLCEVIDQEFRAQGPFRAHHRGVKSAPFRVLMNFDMPAALVECGFLDHPDEGEQLTRADVQQQIANLLFNGMNRYFAMEDPEFRPTRVAASP
jgi:N-acetylmuramoyl-L-alanine amidase